MIVYNAILVEYPKSVFPVNLLIGIPLPRTYAQFRPKNQFMRMIHFYWQSQGFCLEIITFIKQFHNCKSRIW